jgi:hypothetical protein
MSSKNKSFDQPCHHFLLPAVRFRFLPFPALRDDCQLQPQADGHRLQTILRAENK